MCVNEAALRCVLLLYEDQINVISRARASAKNDY